MYISFLENNLKLLFIIMIHKFDISTWFRIEGVGH